MGTLENRELASGTSSEVTGEVVSKSGRKPYRNPPTLENPRFRREPGKAGEGRLFSMSSWM